MSRRGDDLTDEDGIDGPLERRLAAMDRAAAKDGERCYLLQYEAKSGASVCKRLTLAEVLPALKRLRRPAELLRDPGAGKSFIPCGGVEPIDNADDQRIRWQWWFDAEAKDPVARFPGEHDDAGDGS